MKTQKRPFGAYYTAFLAFTQPKIARGSGFLCFSAGMKKPARYNIALFV